MDVNVLAYLRRRYRMREGARALQFYETGRQRGARGG